MKFPAFYIPPPGFKSPLDIYKLYLFYIDMCKENGAACNPNGKCVLSEFATDGWFCHCFHGYIANTATNQHSCVEGNK